MKAYRKARWELQNQRDTDKYYSKRIRYIRRCEHSNCFPFSGTNEDLQASSSLSTIKLSTYKSMDPGLDLNLTTVAA